VGDTNGILGVGGVVERGGDEKKTATASELRELSVTLYYHI
jgi:hypothetical protein